MTPVSPGHFKTRVPSSSVKVATVGHPVRARLSRWPYDPTVAQLVLLDHHMVPDVSDVAAWIQNAQIRGATALRTGALFPASTHAFEQAGFHPLDTLTLLECDLRGPLPIELSQRSVRSLTLRSRDARLSRLRRSDLPEAAAVDRKAFDPPWNNDPETLAEITQATPHHRSRSINTDGQLTAFCISGRTSSRGYVQRVAVDPAFRRKGLGRSLVTDTLQWMYRRNIDRAMVNTSVGNTAAIALYRSLGFEVQPENLVIYEMTFEDRPA